MAKQNVVMQNEQDKPAAEQVQPAVEGGSVSQEQPRQEEQDTSTVSPAVVAQGTPLTVPEGPVPAVPAVPELITYVVAGSIVDANGRVIGKHED